MAPREYQYVGPSEIRECARTQPPGTAIHSAADLRAWLAVTSTDSTRDGYHIATFTVGTDKVLRVAPRRSEHVACAAGGPVLSAGEITIDDSRVVEISNQSTGFCPEPESWPQVELALNQIGLSHPGGFTHVVIFRLCPHCRERNIVKDGWFYCELCDAILPKMWNFPQENVA